ncbi:MAG: hypothetical protein ABSD41_03930 [Candidatus Bathyarchaeia archaeon]
MGRGRLFTILLLLTIVGLTTRSIYPEAGAVTTQTTTSRTLTTSASSLASVTSISSKTSAITSIVSAITSMAPTSSSTLNDLLVLKTKYPKLFNPNNTYTEFASIDLSTNPKANGPPVTFRNVTVTHSYVSGMLVPNGVQWTLTQGPPDVVVFALADYGSQVPTSASLSNSVNTFLVTPRSGAYPHVYLFLVS